VNSFQDEVSRLLLDVVSDTADRLVFLLYRRWCRSFAFEGRFEFIGVVLYLEHRHRGADLIDCALRKLCPRKLLKPLDAAIVRIALVLVRVIRVGPGHFTEPYFGTSFQRENNDIPDLHFMHKTVELARVHRNGARLFLWINLFVVLLEFAAVMKTGKIAHLHPADGNDVLAFKKRFGIAGLASAYTPKRFFLFPYGFAVRVFRSGAIRASGQTAAGSLVRRLELRGANVGEPRW